MGSRLRNRASRVYRERRAVLLKELAEHCPDLRVSGVDAGLHVTIEFPGTDAQAVDDRAVVSTLAAAGFKVAALSEYPAERPRSGLVIGYARANQSHLRAFAAALSTVVFRAEL